MASESNPGAFPVREAIAKCAEHLQSKGVATARLDAELIVGRATGMDRLRLYLDMDRPLAPEEKELARELLRRRAAREPMAYILGQREFRSRMFAVDRRVLVPRPETELLVERALAELPARFPEEVSRDEGGPLWRILELGAGSGAICVSLAAELPTARIVATEASAEAADVARANAATHGVGDRVVVRVQSDFAGVREGIDGELFHAIVANPPYIDPADREGLPPEVRDFEPAGALFAEEKGLAVHRMLLGEAAWLLEPGGFVLVEIGQGQAAAVAEIAAGVGLRVEAEILDYARIVRHLLLVAA